MTRWLSLSLLVGASFVLVEVGVVDAHTRLTSPTPRSDSDGLKSGPCGGVARTDAPMVVSPGETITVAWLETVNHPGYYRIALATTGDADFDDNVLADNITDINCSSTPCSYTQDVVIPDVQCTDCSLQLVQYMGTAAPYSPYFSCADIDVTGASVPDAGMGGGDGDGDGGADGGCQISGRQAGSGVGTLLLVCMVLGITHFRRPKRRRESN